MTVDEEPPYAIHVLGRVDERTFKMSELVTWTQLSVVPGQGRFALRDKLTNHADYGERYPDHLSRQLRGTHSGGGPGCTPVKQISPVQRLRQGRTQGWQTYLGPDQGLRQMVFQPGAYSDTDSNTLAVLNNRAGNAGVAVSYNADSCRC